MFPTHVVHAALPSARLARPAAHRRQPCIPAIGEKRPGGHRVHAASFSRNWPAGQGVQLLASAFATAPRGQVSHEDAPAALMRFAAQLVQLVLPKTSVYWPWAQSWQADAPGANELVLEPREHLPQPHEPAVLVVPAGHKRQAAAPACEYWPL